MIGRTQAQYYSQILQIVRNTPGISRAGLATAMNLDRSTMTNLVNSLVDNGLIVHADSTPSGDRSGRRQIPLMINPDFAVVLGIEIQSDSIVAVLTNMNGKVLSIRKEIVVVNGNNLVQLVKDCLVNTEAEVLNKGMTLLAAGIGITGVVDLEKGMVLESHPLEIFEPLAVLDGIGRDYSFPVFMDNDTNCCCWGVLAFSQDRSIRNFLYVLVELKDEGNDSSYFNRMTTGWGLALQGTVYYGEANAAGEFKSFLCRTHDIEQFSIEYSTRLKMKSQRQIRTQFLRELSRNIAFTYNVLNLSHLYLGGDLEPYRDELSTLIEEEVNINWLYNKKPELNLIYSKSENNPVALGAAGLALEHLYEIPFLKVSPIVSKVYDFQG